MAIIKKLRKDTNGQIITKDNKKNYNIFFKNKIEIIDIKSYKIFYKIKEEENSDDEDFFEDEENINEKKENFIESYQKIESENIIQEDSRSFSRSRCYIC